MNDQLKNIICEHLKNGEVISLATDTVYGLISIATSDQAIKKIYELKNRSIEKPLSILVSSIDMAEKHIALTPYAKKLLLDKNYSFTIIAKQHSHSKLSKHININTSNIALRIPKHNLLIDIMNVLETPLVATSANKSGQDILDNAGDIYEIFGKEIRIFELTSEAHSAISEKTKKIPSAIIDCSTNDIKIVRGTNKQKEYIWNI